MALENAAVTCKIDNVEVIGAEASFVMSLQGTNFGAGNLAVPAGSVHVRIDLNNTAATPFDKIQSLFNLINSQSSDHIKDMKITFWKDMKSRQAFCSYSFKGRVASFRTAFLGFNNGNSGYNHVVDLVLVPVTAEGDFREIRIGN
jgi:hypothetical protein